MSSYISNSPALGGNAAKSFATDQLLTNQLLVQSSAVVAQSTSRATAITTVTQKGRFSLFEDAGSTTAATVTINNANCAPWSVPVLAQVSGTDKYILRVVAITAGSFTLSYATVSGTTTEAPVFTYMIL